MEHIQSIYKRNLLILTALWGFVFGIFVSSLFLLHPLICVLLSFVALAIYLLYKILKGSVSTEVLVLVVFIFTFAFGAFRFAIKDFHELSIPENRGVVVSEPEERDSDIRFVVRTQNREKVLITTSLLNKVSYGDEVVLEGGAKVVKNGSYAKYLSKDDIFHTMDRAGVEVVSRHNGNFTIESLLSIKKYFTEKIKNILPEPESSLLSGLIVSGKQALPKDILEDFRRAGVVHIVVLSGYNIAIIAEFLFLLFGFLGSRRSAVISIFGVILFTLMSGASATVVRGAIMVTLLLFGKIMSRPASQPRILLFTASFMLMYNPKYLVFDPSFQLSFLALLGIVYGTPVLERYLYKLPEKFGFRSIVSTTLATQIFVLPYLLYNMGNFSLVFLLSNMLILPILPLVMLIGFIATLIAFVSNILAWPLAFISHLLLAWVLFVSKSLGGLSFALLEIENFPLWGSLVMYVALVFLIWRLRSFPQQSASLDY